jgi:AraC-like DNA-binding protein/5-hydroxyisourate hydrolase-like protein (transthyretin family)
MSKKDMISLIHSIPYKYHFKIHRMHHLTVPETWHIEENRRNEDFHLLFVTGGKGYYVLNGRKEPLYRGKVIFVSDYFPHSAYPDLSDLPSIIPIRFGVYSNSNHDHVKFFDTPYSFSYTAINFANYRSKFERLYAYYLQREMMGYEQICHSVIYEILTDLLNEMAGSKQTTYDKRIQRVKNEMDRNPDRGKSVNELAEKAGLSNKQFTRLFREYYGTTPKKYQIDVVIRRAEFLLKETNMGVGEAAKQLGYPDAYSFSKQYRKVTGVSPVMAKSKG